MKHLIYPDLSDPIVREQIVRKLSGGYHSVYIGIDTQTIEQVINRGQNFEFMNVSVNSIKSAVKELPDTLPSSASEIIVSLKFRNMSFTLSQLTPLIGMLAAVNSGTNITWGISADENILDEIELNILFSYI